MAAGHEETPDGGVFLVIEGTDASGKTSLRRHLYERLMEKRKEMLSLISFSWLVPRYTEIITGVRHLGARYPEELVIEAYVGDKEALCREIISPNLACRHVTCDRFCISDIVYISVMQDISPRLTYREYLRSAVLKPHVTVFVDTPPEVAFERNVKRLKGSTRNKHPWDVLERQKRIYALFNEIMFSGAYPWFQPVIRIDNSGDFEETVKNFERQVFPHYSL
jgi:thymidylate kinase